MSKHTSTQVRQVLHTCNKHTLQVANTSALKHTKSMQTLTNASALMYSTKAYRCERSKSNRTSKVRNSFPHLYQATHSPLILFIITGRRFANLPTGSHSAPCL